MTRQINRPEPGHYRQRLTRGGPWVAALIFRPCPIEWAPETLQGIDRWYALEAEIDGRSVPVHAVWTSAERVSMAEYLFLRDDRRWAREHAPEAPEANPRKRIDYDTLPPPF